MEEKELNVLEAINDNPKATQRKIAEETGLSLGLVNLLIKKFAKKGILKIESLNKKTVRYILTPKGLKEKSKKTIEYMKINYKRVLKIRNNIIQIIERNDSEEVDLYILGEKDEIYQMVSSILRDLKMDYNHINNINEINTENQIILYWNSDIKINENCYNIIGEQM